MRGYNIESGINSTLRKLDSSLSQVTSQAGQGLGLGNQVNERPWLVLGAALAAGYVLGSVIGGSDNKSNDTASWQERDRSQDFSSRYRDISTDYSGGMGAPSRPNQPSQSYTTPHVTTSGVNSATSGESGTPHYYGPQSSSMGSSGSYTPSSSQYGSQGGSQGTSNYFAGDTSHTAKMPSAPSSSYQPSSAPSSSSYQPSSTSSSSGSQKSAMPSFINDQLDNLTEVAGATVRGFLRDIIRDAVPSMRSQVDALDRRDGRTPGSTFASTGGSTGGSTSGSTTLREVDTTTSRENDPSLI